MNRFLDFELLADKAPLFVWIYIAVVGAILIDLITALHYAKANGRPIVSGGLRRTVDKVVRYYGVLMMGTTIDIILYLCDVYGQLRLFTAPYATAFFAVLLCAIEVKSVFEHRDPAKRKLLKKAGESLLESLTKRDIQRLLDFLASEDKATSKETEENLPTESTPRKGQGGSRRRNRNKRRSNNNRGDRWQRSRQKGAGNVYE